MHLYSDLSHLAAYQKYKKVDHRIIRLIKKREIVEYISIIMNLLIIKCEWIKVWIRELTTGSYIDL